MPQPDDDSHEALNRLDERLKTFKADDAPKTFGGGAGKGGVGEGYLLGGEVVGGVVGGFGLGWTIDHFAHTAPLGLVICLLLGVGTSVFAAVRGAMRMSDKVRARDGVAPDLPDKGDD